MVEKWFTPLWKIRREYTEIYLFGNSVSFLASISLIINLDIVANYLSRISCRNPCLFSGLELGASL